MKKNISKKIFILLKDDICHQLKKLSESEDCSMGDVIRQLIITAYINASIPNNEVIGENNLDLVNDQSCKYEQSFSIGKGRAK